MKSALFFAVYFLYIFGPVFNRLGNWADVIILSSIMLILAHAFTRENLLPKYSNSFLFLIPLFLFAGCLGVVYDRVNEADLAYIILRPVRILITLIAGYALVVFTKRAYGIETFENILRLIFLSIFAHSAIMIVQFLYPTFKEIVYFYTSNGEFRSTFDYDYRMGGLSGGAGGAVLSVMQSIGILLLPFIFRSLSYLRSLMYAFASIPILISILICGRSGIWSLVAFFPLSVYLADKRTSISTILRLSLGAGTILTVLFFLVNYVISLDGSDSPLFHAFNRTLDTLIDLNDYGSFEDATSETLLSQIIFPEMFSTYLFGDAEHLVNTQQNRTLDSDIGYIRNLWGLGILGTIVFLLPIIKNAFAAFKVKFTSKSAGIILIISIVTLVFHCKESFLYTRMIFSVYSLFLAQFYLDGLRGEALSR